MENHRKNLAETKNQKNLEKTKRNKKPRENPPKKTIKQKNNSEGVSVKHPNFLKSLEFMFFVFFEFSRVFCFAHSDSFYFPPWPGD